MIKQLPIALSGFVGGIAPSMIELASLCKVGKAPQFSFYIGAFIIGIMGTVIVLIAKETSPWRALMQGLGTPALLSSATTAVTTVAMYLSMAAVVYAQPPVPASFPAHDSAVVIICQENKGNIVFAPYAKKEPVGYRMPLMKDSLFTAFTVPDTDTVRIMLKVYDPAIRRALVQGLLPMQKDFTEKFEKKLIIEEIH